MKKNRFHLSMKWKLIASFTAITLIVMGVALIQGQKINQVKQSMERQKTEMENRIAVSTLGGLLQEINNLETALAESSDVELAGGLTDKQSQIGEELAKVSFAEGSPAAGQLQQLRDQSGEYAGYVEELTATMEDVSLDPLTVLETIDNIHTQALILNQEMLAANEQLYAAAKNNAEAAQDYSFLQLEHTVSVILYAAGAVFLFTLALGWVLISSFLSPVGKLQAAVSRIAEGDLRQQINSPYNDELGRLSFHFDHMASRVRGMLGQTRSAALALAEYSRSFREASAVTAHTNRDIVRAIQEISAGADEQAMLSERSSGLLQEMKAGVDKIAHYTEDMLATGEAAGRNTRKGAETVMALRERSRSSRESVGRVYAAMEKLSVQSHDISRITGTITEISKQTHILSLNAAIEAARAGASGKGFGVIADEVRHLSEETKQSSIHISGIIRELQEGMSEFQSYMLETKQDLEAQETQVTETLTSFEAIDASISEIGGRIGRIHNKVEEARQINARLEQSIQDVAAVAQQTAAGVEEVNASSTQQDSAIHGIAGQAAEISEISQRLFREIDVFKIGEEDGAEPQPGQVLTLDQLRTPKEEEPVLLAMAE
ncbi:methyl-accepting chemotaxis protein [Paenibacillus tepidiphilus]|uniref:methyl-accepting chemotaxis protein n=1 Tax=Paenibacillus tepidiphilus TaxID=2608683 RepID=UPI00123C23C0|nr:methyl-accepting chemotaxis protein [Paenibacillus tepidiphilus]